ncbi:DUF4974 domain-containing protein [Echinicola soli]|uniref:DUF4974 domain-containing protein n=1 Tax=Echinicola soli TaxID=2591634 RepID=A0A514CJ80_9BACT|nr:FecR domain-containing protein [Echinicola soli]QDH79887.1 DUF4974 domain-containing protein [Echinicola soli]
MDREKQLKAFYNRTLPQEEVEEFLEWYYSKKGEAFLAGRLEAHWEEGISDRDKGEAFDKEANFRQILEKRGNRTLPFKREAKKTSGQPGLGFKIAAGLVIFLSLSLLGYEYFRGNGGGKLKQEAVVMEIKSNPAGQKSKIKLPDGTIVYLNSESSLEYPADFATNRQLKLRGEAFFEVFPDKEHPFSVESRGIRTTALGTAFNIKAYGDMAETEVALAHGKVLVEAASDDHLELKPGEAAVSNEHNGAFKKKNVNIEEILYWKEGILHFDGVSFDEVVNTLERWYNVSIYINGKYDGKFQCSGTFDKNEYLDNVLDILGHSIGFDFQINKKKVTLTFHPN